MLQRFQMLRLSCRRKGVSSIIEKPNCSVSSPDAEGASAFAGEFA